MGLQISGTASSYTMSDDYGNTKVFTNGYLTEIKDGYGNAIYYCYDSNAYSAGSSAWKPTASGAHKITSVYRSNKDGGAAEQLLLLGYNGTRLSTIITKCDFSSAASKDKHRITLGITTENNAALLTSILYPDGKEARYTYYTGASAHFSARQRLKTAYDAEANYGVEYSYGYNADVINIYEYVLNGSTVAYGAKLHGFKRAHSQSVYRYYGKDQIKGADGASCDDLLTFRVLDQVGRTISSYTTDSTEQHILGVGAAGYTVNGGTSKKNNRLNISASGGRQGINLLRNSSAENGTTYWTGASVSSAEHYIGAKSFTLQSGALYQTVSLNGQETYTFSAYVKLPNNPTSGGVKLAFQNNGGAVLQESELVAYATTGVNGGWQRLTVTYTPSQSLSNARVAVVVTGGSSVYADCLQLECEDAASTYNLLEDGSLENTSAFPTSASFGWYKYQTPCIASAQSTYFGQKYAEVSGSEGQARISQNVALNLSAGTSFLLSGWAKADADPQSIPKVTSGDADKPYFGLIVRIYYTDNTSEPFYFPFDPYFADWQYVQGVVVPAEENQNKAISRAVVVAAYDNNINKSRLQGYHKEKPPEMDGLNYTLIPRWRAAAWDKAKGQNCRTAHFCRSVGASCTRPFR